MQDPKKSRPDAGARSDAPRSDPAVQDPLARGSQPAEGEGAARPANQQGRETPAAAEPAESPEQAIESLREQLAAAEDRALRTQAELENFRKRVGRERADERRYANLGLMRDVLPVLDNLDRAIEAAEKTHDASALLEGVKMVNYQLVGVLAKHDCVPIEALNEPFDPHRHEAILQQPSDDVPAGIVTQVTQIGYRLHDRVVRPTQVIVSAGPAPSEE